MKYELETTDNGYILREIRETRDDETLPEILVFEEKDSEDGEKEAFVSLVYQLADRFGFIYNKFAKDNLRVDFKRKGNKYEDTKN